MRNLLSITTKLNNKMRILEFIENGETTCCLDLDRVAAYYPEPGYGKKTVVEISGGSRLTLNIELDELTRAISLQKSYEFIVNTIGSLELRPSEDMRRLGRSCSTCCYAVKDEGRLRCDSKHGGYRWLVDDDPGCAGWEA